MYQNGFNNKLYICSSFLRALNVTDIGVVILEFVLIYKLSMHLLVLLKQLNSIFPILGGFFGLFVFHPGYLTMKSSI